MGGRILVTGGAGAIGSSLAQRLLDEGHTVIVIDNLSSGSLDNLPVHENLEMIKGDIRNDDLLRKVFSYGLDQVFHLAAFFANQNSIEHPKEDLSVNGMGTLQLLIHAHANGIKKFVYASSACVYDPSPEPIEENQAKAFETPYSLTKYLGELYVGFYTQYYSLPCIIVRYFNSFGPHEFPGAYRCVIPNFFFRAMNGQPLTIYGQGEESRCFCYVDDIVNGTMLASQNEDCVGRVINIGSENEVKIKELATIINELCNNRDNIIYEPKRRWDRTIRRVPNINLAKSLLGYEPQTDFRVGLERTWQWFKDKLIFEKHYF